MSLEKLDTVVQPSTYLCDYEFFDASTDLGQNKLYSALTNNILTKNPICHLRCKLEKGIKHAYRSRLPEYISPRGLFDDLFQKEAMANVEQAWNGLFKPRLLETHTKKALMMIQS
jgi:hypothetical protein